MAGCVFFANTRVAALFAAVFEVEPVAFFFTAEAIVGGDSGRWKFLVGKRDYLVKIRISRQIMCASEKKVVGNWRVTRSARLGTSGNET